MGRSLFEKLWDSHVVRELGDGYCLLHVDRHVVNDIMSPGFAALVERGLPLFSPELTSAVPDHMVPTTPLPPGGRMPILVSMTRDYAPRLGARLIDVNDPGFGIVHQIAPEQAIALPGVTFTCGDSHSSTVGGLGALAWGVGQSEVNHILATQTSIQQKPKAMRLRLTGRLAPGVAAKDVVLRVIALLGARVGVGYAVEFAGPLVEGLDMDGRFTMCNMGVELGARFGLVGVDTTTIAYIGRGTYAPRGEAWRLACASWQDLHSDADAHFDRDLELDLGDLQPQITWGTTIDQTIGVTGRIPDPAEECDEERRAGMESALRYMDLAPGDAIEGLPIDRVFIGSCTNARLADLQAAARIVEGRKVAPGVEAWVVPGSTQAKLGAEALGLDRVFVESGFQWRLPSCSMCAAANGDIVGPGQRIVSTTNRNYEGRQGPGARTHVASPAMAAAAAIAGRITDARALARG